MKTNTTVKMTESKIIYINEMTKEELLDLLDSASKKGDDLE